MLSSTEPRSLNYECGFELNKNGEVLKEWYGKTVIHSDKRFTYEEAYQNILDDKSYLHKELSILNQIAKT